MILFITGTRADYGKLRPLIKAVNGSVFVTGMHTQAEYGYTAHEIYNSGVETFTLLNRSDTIEQSLSCTIDGLSRYMQEVKPDMVVVHGDRAEALAGAITGALRGVLVAHVEGGELSGNIDESIRHAITKLSHIHFTANEETAQRLRQLGEKHIFIIGSPDIDVMLGKLPSLSKVKKRYGILFKEYAIAILHPSDYSPRKFVDTLINSGKNYVVIHPNNEKGNKEILREYKRLNERFVLLPSMRFEWFLRLLKEAEFIIGNSSVGIREAPVYGVNSIDLGSRQRNRYRCKTIIHTNESLEAIQKIKGNHPPNYHFGKGDSANLFKEALKNVWQIPTQKEFIDL